MATKTKKFDTLEMSRQLRQATSRKLETMDREQQLAYLRQMAERHRAESKTHQAIVGTKS